MSGFDLVRSPSTFASLIVKFSAVSSSHCMTSFSFPTPPSAWKPLQLLKAGLWRLRVGDYRVIVSVQRSGANLSGFPTGCLLNVGGPTYAGETR